jgi:beta-xylosidase
VARSRKLLGPWEKNPANPILKGNDTWKCPGHGSIVADQRGRDFLLYHAYHARDFVYVGREALLDEVKWNADGWPTINDGKGPSVRAPSPAGIGERNAEYAFRDEFSSPRLAPGWQWPQSNEPVFRVQPASGGRLILSARSEQAANPIGAVLARSTTVGQYTAETLVDVRGLKAGELAGLSAYGDDENALGLSVGGGKVILWRREKNQHQTVETADAPPSPLLYLRMTARDGHRYRFAVSRNGRDWKTVGGEVDGQYLPPWDRGVRVALTAGGSPNVAASFEWLSIIPSRSF